MAGGAMTDAEFAEKIAGFIVDEHDDTDASFQGYDAALQRKYVRFETAGLTPQPWCTFTMPVETEHCNMLGTLHGGCVATVMDMCSSLLMAALARPGFWESMGGVSRNLNVRYLRPVPKGRSIRVHSQVVHAGKRSALLRITVTDLESGEVCVVGEHDKVNNVKSRL